MTRRATIENVSLDLADLADLGDLAAGPGGDSAGRLGGKAVGLGRLIASGRRVPRGFVVPDDAVAALTAVALAEPLARLDAATLAVRSSGRDEDGRTRSGAGAYLTVLDVPPEPDAVLDAVRRVHASGEQVSVIVQEQVDARFSGVAFSVDPVSGDDRVVLSAVPGVGDRLLAGEVAGESWRVLPSGEVEGEGTLLDRDLVVELAALVRSLADEQGRHVDVEWSVEGGTGDVVLLQCRPVTAVPTAPRFTVPPGTWTKDVSHAPGPLSPMATSLPGADLDFFAEWAARFGFVVKGIRPEYFGGEPYLQVVPLLGRPDSPGPPPPWWLLGVAARLVPPVRRRMAAARRVLRSGVPERLAREWVTRHRPDVEARLERFRATDLTGLDDDALLEHAAEVQRLVLEGLRIHFDLFVPYLLRAHAFVRVAEELLGWTTAEALQTLAGWSPASAGSTRRLSELAARIAADPRARVAVSTATDPVTALADLPLDHDPGLAADVSAWLAEEGFLLTDDDVASPTVGEVPGLLTGLLREAVDRCAAEPTDAEASAAARLQDRAEARLRSATEGLAPADRARCQQAWVAAREAFGLREENVRLVCYAPLAALRLTLLEMGRRVAARGLLGDPARTMLLTWEELSGALRGDAATDLDAVAQRRRAELAWVRAHPGPLVLGPEPGADPDLRGLPAAGRRINEALLWAIGQELVPPSAPADGAVAGAPCGAGRYTGTARIVRGPGDFDRLRSGDVLVAPIAPPSWATLFGRAGAVVCDAGGPLSHSAIVAREHGLPTVMGTGTATAVLRDGELVTVDGTAGTVVPVSGTAVSGARP